MSDVVCSLIDGYRDRQLDGWIAVKWVHLVKFVELVQLVKFVELVKSVQCVEFVELAKLVSFVSWLVSLV